MKYVIKNYELIKIKRDNLKISQKRLANKLNISQGYMSKIEKGKVAVEYELIRKISKILKCEFIIEKLKIRKKRKGKHFTFIVSNTRKYELKKEEMDISSLITKLINDKFNELLLNDDEVNQKIEEEIIRKIKPIYNRLISKNKDLFELKMRIQTNLNVNLDELVKEENKKKAIQKNNKFY